MLLPEMKASKKRTNKDFDYINYEVNPTSFGEGKTYFVLTYGCQMNERDGENIKAILENMGYVEGKDIYSVDVAILNTCAVRENAHNKVFGMLGRLKHEKDFRDFIIGMCGCMPQEESVANELLEKHKYVDLVFGTHNINNLSNLIKEAYDSRQIEVYSKEGEVVEGLPIKRMSNIKALVNIMYGCDKFCTYCIVPYTRGAERSRKKEDIINEITELKENGYKEVTLLGQNVNAYGKDIKGYITFGDLLKLVSDTGIERIRFLTSHPWDFDDKMIDIIAERKNIMPYVHLPLQSGSDEILKKMGRRYTQKEYLDLAKKIRDKIPRVSITTDIIVGFPNESEKDFEETLKVVNEVKYDSAFTFIYSKREGTPAALMEDDVLKCEKEKRLSSLNEIVNKYALENNEKYINKKVKVLFENIHPKDSSLVTGYSDTGKLVNAKGDESVIGMIKEVLIEDVKSFSMNGKIV